MDVPEIDSVLFAAPKDSLIDIVQAAGRPLRLSGEADTAAIIVPAVLPDDGSPGEDGGPAGGRTSCGWSARSPPMTTGSAPA